MEKDKYDFEYAHTVFAECIVQDPNNLVYVESFLTNLSRKYDNNKKGARFGGLGGKGAFKKAYSKKDWREVLKAGPDVLKTNPWDIPTLRAMAEACAALDYREVELRYLKNALEAAPKDAEVNRHCAKTLQRMGQFDQAIVCWHRVEEANPNEAEAPKMISELQVEKTRAKAGFGPALAVGGGGISKSAAAAKSAATHSIPPVPKESEKDKAAEETRKRELQLTPRQRLERQIQEFPEEVDNYLRLSELHLDEDRPGEAERVLTKALSASGNDARVRERLEDVQIVKQRHKVAVAEKLAANDKSKAAQDLVVQLRGELNRVELEIFTSRSQRHPNDLGLKFQLGLRLKRAGNYAEAAKHLQEATAADQHRAAAVLEVGECLQMLKQYPTSLEFYRRAATFATESNQVELRKLGLYRAGVLATGMKEYEQAETALAELSQLDPAYKDVRDRLDKVREIRHKG